jgi:hypothetical protein
MRRHRAMSIKWTATLLTLGAILNAGPAAAQPDRRASSTTSLANSVSRLDRTARTRTSPSRSEGPPARILAANEPEGAATTPPPPASQAGMDAGANTAQTAAPEPKESQAPPSIFVEELPGSAFLRPRVPGLVGGSLWLETSAWATQWPYVARTGVGISGSAWVDTGYEQIKSSSLTHADTVFQLQQGRALLRLTPTYSTGQFFVQGQAELVANKDQSVSQAGGGVVDTDDLWVRVGRWNVWDLQFGRFQGWEIYHLGMGLDLNTLERHGATDSAFADPVDFYGVTYGYYRANGVGNVGLHLFPTDFLRFELLGHVGFETGLNTIGGRPTAVLDILGGIIRVKVGGEYRSGHALRSTSDPATGAKIDGPEKLVQSGFGGAIQVILAPAVEFGVNAAQGTVDHTSSTGSVDAGGSFDVRSFGGFANLSIGGIARQDGLKDLLLGLGADYTTKKDISMPNTTNLTNLQAFGALQYLFGGQLYVKLVAAYDRGTWEHVQNDTGPKVVNKMLSARVRVMYLF